MGVVRLPGFAVLLLCLAAVLQAHGALWLYGEPQCLQIMLIQAKCNALSN